MNKQPRPAPSGDYVQSLGRGLEILAHLGSEDGPRMISDMSEITGINRATTRRLLTTLETLGFVARRGREFRLTSRVLGLGYTYLSQLGASEVLSDVLRGVSAELGEAISVSVREKDQIIYIARERPPRVMTVALGIGARLPVWNTSMGRVLLAALSDDELRQLWLESTPPPQATTLSLTAFQDILERVHQGRSSGWVMVDQELEWGLRSVAVPIHRAGRVVAALNAATSNVGEAHELTVQRLMPSLARGAKDVGLKWEKLPPIGSLA